MHELEHDGSTVFMPQFSHEQNECPTQCVLCEDARLDYEIKSLC